MRKLLFTLVLSVLFISCKKQVKYTIVDPQVVQSEDSLNRLGINPSDLIPGSYVFFLDESIYPPISEEDYDFSKMTIDDKLIQGKKDKILKAVKENSSFIVKDKDVYVVSFSAISIENITVAQAQEFIAKNFVLYAQQNFTFQNIRAKMQSDGPVNQNVRAKMQEWQYDSTIHTSTNITYVNPSGFTGIPTSKIWIVDSGVDGNHQDLNVLDTTELSKSFVNSEPNPLQDFHGHGTHCAGIAAGRAHNNSNMDLLGMNGVSPNAPIVSVKVIDWNGLGDWANVLEAMEYIAVEASPGDVVNLSFGAFLPGMRPNRCKPGNGNELKGILNQIEFLAIRLVYVVMAGGNENKNSNTFYPGCYELDPYIITVGSIRVTYDFNTSIYSNPAFSSFSTYSMPSIDFVAPGELMFSTFPNNMYAVLSGTSMSAALVSGIVHLTGGLPNGNQKVPGLQDPSVQYPIAKVP